MKVFDTLHLEDLKRLVDSVDSLYAHSGWDCPEYALSALRATLTEPGLEGIDVMLGGEVILITDASAKDDYLADEIIQKAKEKDICIHFFLSGYYGCRNDFGSFSRVANETNGTVVHSNIHFNDLDDIFSTFSARYSSSQCGSPSMYSPPQRCYAIKVSILTAIIKIHIRTDKSHSKLIISDGTEIFIDVDRGYALYKETHPISGNWSICTESGTLTILVDQQISMDAVVSYIRKDSRGPTGVTVTTGSPLACELLLQIVIITFFKLN